MLDGVQRLLDELEKLGIKADDVIVSTNLQTRLDGYPRSNQSRPQDTGVAVYWQKANEPMRCMAVDRYDEVADNLAAVAATLDAMRAIERHGGAAILDRAFTGFAALPAPTVIGLRAWWVVLGFREGFATTADQVRDRYRELARTNHPDRGGSTEKMAEINWARDEALRVLGDKS